MRGGSIAERIEAKVVRVPFSGCWIFCGSLDTSGYGLIGVGGIGMRALAREYGVTKFPIQRIINGTGWKHI